VARGEIKHIIGSSPAMWISRAKVPSRPHFARSGSEKAQGEAIPRTKR
jgi:hypothetical protein